MRNSSALLVELGEACEPRGWEEKNQIGRSAPATHGGEEGHILSQVGSYFQRMNHKIVHLLSAES